MEEKQPGSFWKWVGIIAFAHLVAIALLTLFFQFSPTPPPPPAFISLVPSGDLVKGTAGAQKAPKVGTASPAQKSAPITPPKSSSRAEKSMPPPPPQPKQAATPAPAKPAPSEAAATPKAAKPAPPKPKVKVDLHEIDRTVTADQPVTKPKPHPKHAAAEANDANSTPANPETTGLSKEQIAAQLGDKLSAEGIKNAAKIGPSGSPHSQSSPFADFYATIREQIMDKYQRPNLADAGASYPVVQIHVEKDGRVPAESVILLHSSGNPIYDESALSAARSLGYLLQPLPDGCPPDISINFKLIH